MITGRGSALQPDPAQRKTMLVARVVKLLYSVALRRIGGVMFQNPDDLAFFIDERMLQERTAHRIINGSGVDIDHFACSPLPEGPVTFIFVGRLLRNKGIQDYADACEQLAQQGVSARFKVLGPLDSNPNAITSHQIEAWKRGGVVEYLGAAQDVRPALASAHVLVLPSSYGEGTPRSVLEAMSMGRAIITTTAPGCKEPVQDRVNGFLIPVKDPKALVDAMLEFVQKPELIPRFGAESRRIAEARYDVRLVTADILSFMGVTKGPGSAVTPAAPSPSPK